MVIVSAYPVCKPHWNFVINGNGQTTTPNQIFKEHIPLLLFLLLNRNSWKKIPSIAWEEKAALISLHLPNATYFKIVDAIQ